MLINFFFIFQYVWLKKTRFVQLNMYCICAVRQLQWLNVILEKIQTKMLMGIFLCWEVKCVFLISFIKFSKVRSPSLLRVKRKQNEAETESVLGGTTYTLHLSLTSKDTQYWRAAVCWYWRWKQKLVYIIISVRHLNTVWATACFCSSALYVHKCRNIYWYLSQLSPKTTVVMHFCEFQSDFFVILASNGALLDFS